MASLTTSVNPHSTCSLHRNFHSRIAAFNYNYCPNSANEPSSCCLTPKAIVQNSSRTNSGSTAARFTVRSAATKPAKSPGTCYYCSYDSYHFVIANYRKDLRNAPMIYNHKIATFKHNLSDFFPFGGIS